MYLTSPRSGRSTMPIGDNKSRAGADAVRPGAGRESRERARLDRDAAKSGAQIVCLPELFRSQYFCQSEDHANFALAEDIPGPSTDALTKLARETSRRHRRLAFRKTRRRRLSQHRGDHRRRRQYPREISQDAHPGRSVLLRKILFHAGRSRFSELGKPRTGISASAFAGTSGIRKRRA